MLRAISDDRTVSDALPDRVFEFCRSPQSFLLNLSRTEGPIARFRVNSESFAVLSDPDAIHAVLNGSMDDFEKGELYDLVEAVFGESIFTSDGSDWTILHQVISPLFSPVRVNALALVVHSVVERHMERWTRRIEAGESLDLLTDTKRLAFDVMARGLIGIDYESAAADRIFDILHRGDRVEGVRLKYLGKRIPGIHSHFRRSSLQDELNREAYEIAHKRIAAAAQPGGQSEDLVGSVLSSRYFQNLPDQQKPRFIRDLLASMLSAGYVTTGDSIFWSMVLLARHRIAQERARQEVAVSGSSPWIPAVINETLRLYPSVWFLGRIARRPVEVGGVRFEAGTRLFCSPYVLHRMAAIWPDPDEFRPERFLAPAAVTPRSFIPFGSGVRRCIGRGLATMELSDVLPAALSRFELHLDDDRPITLAATFSMQPREPVHVRMTRR